MVQKRRRISWQFPAKGVELKLKMKNGFLIIILLILAQGGRAQGFVNLDFEDATITPVVPQAPQYIYANTAIPGWTAYLDATPQEGIFYDTVSAGGAAVILENVN